MMMVNINLSYNTLNSVLHLRLDDIRNSINAMFKMEAPHMFRPTQWLNTQSAMVPPNKLMIANITMKSAGQQSNTCKCQVC